MASVFISYTSRDRDWAFWIAHCLSASGHEPRVHEWEIAGGGDIVAWMDETIAKVDFVLCVISQAYLAAPYSSWERRAAQWASAQGRPGFALPVFVEPCTAPLLLAHIKRCDLYGISEAEARLRLEKFLAPVEQTLHPPPFPGGAEAKVGSESVGLTPPFPGEGRSTPARAGIRVVVDQSYQQERWHAQPIISAGYSDIARSIEEYGTVRVNYSGYKTLEPLNDVDVLVLPVPFGTYVEGIEYDKISNWVYLGGGLLVLGTYLMDLHHYNNFNLLLRRFDIEFAHDLLMPLGRETFQDGMAQSFAYFDTDLWVTTKPSGEPSNHVLLRDIDTLAFTSSCSVESAGNPEVTVYTSEPVAVMHARGRKGQQSDRLIQLTNYIPNKHDSMPFLLAVRHGAGRVVAAGTWKMFLNVFTQDGSLSNKLLFTNIIRWLGPESSGSRMLDGSAQERER